jgi:hypothetical protein
VSKKRGWSVGDRVELEVRHTVVFGHEPGRVKLLSEPGVVTEVREDAIKVKIDYGFSYDVPLDYKGLRRVREEKE